MKMVEVKFRWLLPQIINKNGGVWLRPVKTGSTPVASTFLMNLEI